MCNLYGVDADTDRDGDSDSTGGPGPLLSVGRWEEDEVRKGRMKGNELLFLLGGDPEGFSLGGGSQSGSQHFVWSGVSSNYLPWI